MMQRKGEFSQSVHIGIAIHGNVLDILEPDARLRQAVPNGLARKSSPMFDSAEAFLFCRCDQLAIPYQTRRGVTVIRIEA